MGYVGNQTTNSYTSMDKQSITGNGGTSYTLDHAVANVNEIEVFVNNVRQEPSVAYTVAGTALTMTGNVASSDDFYVVFQGKALQTVVPPDGSVTNAKLASGAAASNLGTSVNLATIKDSTGTNTAMTIDSSGYVNMPNTAEIDIWYLTSNISISGSTTGVISGLARWATNWEIVGTGMTESSGVFTFPSTGKWKAFAKLYGSSSSTAHYMGLQAALSTDSGSSFNNLGFAYQGATSGEYFDTSFPFYIDVTDASTHRVKFNYQTHGSGSIGGHSSELKTFFIFEKLAST